jgi:hypothetical protein
MKSHDDTMLEKVNINPVWPQCDDFLPSRFAQANVSKCQHLAVTR